MGRTADAFETPAKLQQQIIALQKRWPCWTPEGELQVMGDSGSSRQPSGNARA